MVMAAPTATIELCAHSTGTYRCYVNQEWGQSQFLDKKQAVQIRAS